MVRAVLVGCLMVGVGCGGDDDGSSGPRDAAAADARAAIDAGSPDAAPDAGTSECPALEPGAGSGFPNCNPLTHEGCADGEKCAWLELGGDPDGRTDCVPGGTVAIGDACVEGAPGETTGFDDCAAGGQCVSDLCRAVCTIDSDSCCAGFACSTYASLFDDDADMNTGVCDPVCDPVAQDCEDGNQGCYLQLFNGKATCARVATGAEEQTQGDTCVNDGSFCFLNGCAKGYGAFLYVPDAPRDCTAFCSPVDTYLVDPDGDGTGDLVAGADADGAAPSDCSAARIGVPGHQCRFFQSHFLDMNAQYLDYVSDSYGFCAPRGGDYGNCNRFSREWFFEQYNLFIEGGGTPDEWGVEIAARCDATPARCAAGCASLATLEALDAAYCAVPANMTRPACIDGLGRGSVRRSLERYWAEQRVRAAAVTD